MGADLEEQGLSGLPQQAAEAGEALAGRMRALSARDLMAVLAALLRGGGEHELADGLSAARVDARAAAEAVAAAFAASV